MRTYQHPIYQDNTMAIRAEYDEEKRVFDLMKKFLYIVGAIFIVGAEINAALMKYRVKHLILDRIRGVRKQPQTEDDSMEDEAIAREQGANAGR